MEKISTDYKRLCSFNFCFQCMLQFLLDYPLGTKLQRFLEFYVSQLRQVLRYSIVVLLNICLIKTPVLKLILLVLLLTTVTNTRQVENQH